MQSKFVERGGAAAWEPWVFRALIAFFLLYGVAFIYKTSFVVAGERNFALFDDAMISMSYARSLASGHGLVWFPGGPRVEGFTNLLWVLIMAGVHLLPVVEAKLSLIMQLAGLALLAANLIFVRALALKFSGGSAIAAIGGVFLTAFYSPLNSWSLQGTEVSALALILTAATYLSCRGLGRGRPSIGAYGLLGLATLLRLDALVPLVIMTVSLFFADRPNSRRHLVLAGGTIVAFVGGQTLFRLAYFGQVLPNTYYLKLSGYPAGDRILHGASVFGDFALRFNPLLLVLPLAFVFYRRRHEEMLAGLIFLGQCAYSIYVGGDAWEQFGGANRFICVAMPLLFIAIGVALAEAIAFLSARGGARLGRKPVLIAIVLLLMAVMVQVNWGKATPGLRTLLLMADPIELQGDMTAVVQGKLVRALTTEDATAAVVWAGNVPYFCHRPAVDLLGRCDARIARGRLGMSPQTLRSVGFYPGHMKWDYAYSIGELKPDVICHLWGFPDPTLFTGLERVPADALPYVQGNYVLANVGGYRFLFRRDSERIFWSKVQPYLTAD